jgi:hypothetical protein
MNYLGDILSPNILGRITKLLPTTRIGLIPSWTQMPISRGTGWARQMGKIGEKSEWTFIPAGRLNKRIGALIGRK